MSATWAQKPRHDPLFVVTSIDVAPGFGNSLPLAISYMIPAFQTSLGTMSPPLAEMERDNCDSRAVVQHRLDILPFLLLLGAGRHRPQRLLLHLRKGPQQLGRACWKCQTWNIYFKLRTGFFLVKLVVKCRHSLDCFNGLIWLY